MRKFLNVIVLMVFVLTTVLTPCANAIDIGEVVMSETEIVPGVTHTYIRKMTTDGMLDINVVKADLENEHLALKLLTDGDGVSYLSKTTTLAKSEEDVVAAVNADFFSWAKGLSSRGSSIGPVVKDGAVLSTNGTEKGVQTVVHQKNGDFLWGALNFDVTVVHEPTERPTPVPTVEPTTVPTLEPTEEPTAEPTAEPTTEPATDNKKPVSVKRPTIGAVATKAPTALPTAEPITVPTTEPTAQAVVVTQEPQTQTPAPTPTPKPAPQTVKIKTVNKFDDLAQIVMYTRDFATHTTGSNEGVVEVVVREGLVTAININKGPVEIPEDGYVLSSIIENTFLSKTVGIGDKLTVDVSVTFNGEDFSLAETELALGGGAMLVINGEVPKTFTHNITGRNPRSGMGIDKEGKTLYFVTVDGRLSSSIGLSQKDFAELLKEKGAYNAIAFDGGGSTTLVTRTDGKLSVANNLSDGSERAVANALGIVSSAKPTGNVVRIGFEFEEETVFKGTSVGLRVYGYDEYGYKKEIPPVEVLWTVSDNGYEKEGRFYPTKSGEAQLQATYKELSATESVTVLDKVNYLEAVNEQITLKTGESVTLKLKGWDIFSDGAPINLADVKTTVTGDAGVLSGNVFVAEKSGKVLIKAEKDGAVCHFSIGVDENPDTNYKKSQMVKDEYKTTKGEGATKFVVFGNTGRNATAMQRFIINNSMAHIQKTEGDGVLCAFVGETVDKTVIGELKMKRLLGIEYTTFTEGNNTFIQLDNPQYSLSKTSGQWTFLKQTLEGKTGDNVFFFMDRQKLTSDYETKLFYQLIDTYLIKKGKNVWIFSYDEEITSKFTDKINYVTINGMKDTMSAKTYGMWRGSINYLVVYVNGTDVTYSVKNIM